MKIQQLEYIVALDQYRHFVKASKHCGITQPTLSHMVKKLENELGVPIFDRSKHPIEPTTLGVSIINQAKKVLKEAGKIEAMVKLEVDGISGPLKIGVIPTLATYLVPELIGHISTKHPEVSLSIMEMQTNTLIEALQKDEIDMFIAATPLEVDNFFEIPLYYEQFLAYFSKDHPFKDIPLSADNMPDKNLWVLQEGHCLRDQIFNFCKNDTPYNHSFEAGSIETLIRIIDNNGGYSIIPALHESLLTPIQKENIRPIENPPAIREISLVIKNDFFKEKLLNVVVDAVKERVPENMLNERLKKFSIRL